MSEQAKTHDDIIRIMLDRVVESASAVANLAEEAKRYIADPALGNRGMYAVVGSLLSAQEGLKVATAITDATILVIQQLQAKPDGKN